jgi:hypothetical protein
VEALSNSVGRTLVSAWWNPRKTAAFGWQMTEEAEGRYFAHRELNERAMSRRAANRPAAAAHEELAERYEALAVVFGAKPPLISGSIISR